MNKTNLLHAIPKLLTGREMDTQLTNVPFAQMETPAMLPESEFSLWRPARSQRSLPGRFSRVLAILFLVSAASLWLSVPAALAEDEDCPSCSQQVNPQR